MDKRTFLKKSTVLGLGGVITSSSLTGKLIGSTGFINRDTEEDDRFSLPELNYPYDALEPYIDARTMEIHHSKHHAGYTNKFNAAVKGTELADMKVKDMFKNVSEYPVAVRNNGGGYFNHKLYWKFMSPKGGGQPQGDLMDAINKFFGSFENFKEKFSTAASTQFGSGWAWLVVSDNKLVITSTPNQDNPLMDIAVVKGEPILNIDVWEHAYYLKYQNRRTDYIAAFLNVINWDYVGERFKNAM